MLLSARISWLLRCAAPWQASPARAQQTCSLLSKLGPRLLHACYIILAPVLLACLRYFSPRPFSKLTPSHISLSPWVGQPAENMRTPTALLHVGSTGLQETRVEGQGLTPGGAQTASP